MKSLSLSFIAFIVCISCTAQKIPWQEGVKLSWKDFTGVPNARSEHFASTGYGIDYTWKWDGAGKITIDVNCTFDRSTSWKKTEHNLTPELLMHEQVHFDITEVFARKLRKAFAEYTATHKHNDKSKEEISAIFQKNFADTEAFQDTYDAETDHSKIKDKQAEWNKKVLTLLAQYAEYKK